MVLDVTLLGVGCVMQQMRETKCNADFRRLLQSLEDEEKDAFVYMHVGESRMVGKCAEMQCKLGY